MLNFSKKISNNVKDNVVIPFIAVNYGACLIDMDKLYKNIIEGISIGETGLWSKPSAYSRVQENTTNCTSRYMLYSISLAYAKSVLRGAIFCPPYH